MKMDPRIQPHSLHTLLSTSKQIPKTNKKQATKFHNLLQTKLSKTTQLKISKHAKERMDHRGIKFSNDEWLTIQKKVEEAKQKGVSDSLVLTEDAALIVSAKNETVITALNRNEARSHIFTNINGTIIID